MSGATQPTARRGEGAGLAAETGETGGGRRSCAALEEGEGSLTCGAILVSMLTWLVDPAWQGKSGSKPLKRG